MDILQRYTLGKTERLKSRKLIGQLFEKGNAFSNFPFRVIWLFTERQPPLQAGFSVSSKIFKNATDRNRVKRLMREAWRLQKNELVQQLLINNQQLAVFMIYTGRELPEFKEVMEKKQRIITRLIKIVNEKTAKHT